MKKALTKQQEQTLLAELIERTGSRPGLPEFVDNLLLLLEDIPGFEGVDDDEVAALVVRLSETYRDKHRKRNPSKK